MHRSESKCRSMSTCHKFNSECCLFSYDIIFDGDSIAWELPKDVLQRNQLVDDRKGKGSGK